MRDLISILQGYPGTLQAIGVFGFSIYIAAFTLLQTGRICGNSATYTCFVVTAASCVLISLLSAFNLAAFLIQSSYVCIGLFGLARRFVIRRLNQNRYRPVSIWQSFAAAMRKSH